MTGKQLKEFAALVPDHAVVEMDEGYSSANWKPLDVAKIRARLIVTPKVEESEDESTLRNLQSVNE